MNNQELVKIAAGLYNRLTDAEWALHLRRAVEEARELESAKQVAMPAAGMLEKFTTPLAAGAAIVGATLIAEQISKIAEKMYNKHQSKKYFEKMLEAHPQLQNEDPAEVAKYWSSLMHFSPYMAQDPLAAGAYITQSLKRLSGQELGGPPPDTFNSLSQIQKQSVEGLGKKDTLTRDTLSKILFTQI